MKHPHRLDSTIFVGTNSSTINSDNPTIFGGSESEEYLLVDEARVLRAGELEAIGLEGLAD